jgi:hypothetical protein
MRYVYEDVDRHGNVRVYFWRGKGHKKIRLRAVPGTPEFRAAYNEALASATAAADTNPLARTQVSNPKVGTWGWLCQQYLNSGEFKQLGPHTQRRRRQLLQNTWDEPVAPGASEHFVDFPLSRMTSKAIRVLRDRKAHVPESANGLIKAIRQVFTWALSAELPGVSANLGRDVPYFESKGDGFHT